MTTATARGTNWLGSCDGGPWAGRRMVHNEQRVYVPMLAPIRLRAGVDEPSPVIEGYYEFDDGAWRWHAP
jgi:hypothetical protein